MPEGPAVSQIGQLYTVATIPMLLFLSKPRERCVPSSILLKYEELHVWMTLSTHPESLCMRNRGRFKTFVVSQLKCRCCSASSREERKTHHYKLHPTPEDGILWLPWLRRENYKKFSNCYQVALHTWLNAWCT